METTIRGEYWFDESGNTMYADGDVGDMNHESYVIQRCAGEVCSHFDCYMDMEVSLEQMEESILSHIIDELDIEDEDEKEDAIFAIKNDPAEAMIQYLAYNGLETKEKANDLVLIGYGSSGDAREYAIKNWNWARVHRDSIEVNKLDRETLRLVARGIDSALSEENIFDYAEHSYSEEDDVDLFEDIFEIYDDSEDYESRLEAFRELGTDEKVDMAIDNHKYSVSTYTGNRYSIKLVDMRNGNVEGLERSDHEIDHPTAATQQVRKMDVDSMPSIYKGVIGDSYAFDSLYQKMLLVYSENV